MERKEPFQLVVSGVAGSGKSRLFLLIKEGLEIILNLIVKSLGLTGTAAYNIGGSTLHDYFKLGGEKLQSYIDL